MSGKTLIFLAATVSLAASLQFGTFCVAQSAFAALPSSVAPLSPETPTNKSTANDTAGDSESLPGKSAKSKRKRSHAEKQSTPADHPSSAQPSSQPAPPPPADQITSPPPATTIQPPIIQPPPTGYIHYSPGVFRFHGSPIINRNIRANNSESVEELKQKLDLTLKTDGPRSALAVQQMCDLVDRYIDTGEINLALPLIDQLIPAYKNLGTDDQHYLAHRLIDQSQRILRTPGYGVRPQLLSNAVLTALHKGHWIDADNALSNSLLNLSNQYMAQRHELQAEPVMKAALTIVDTKPKDRLRSSMHVSMATIYERLMRFNDAEREYKLALASVDNDNAANMDYSQQSRILTQLCTMYLHLNQKDKLQATLPDMINIAKEMSFNYHYVWDQFTNQLLASDMADEAEKIVDAEIDSGAQHMDQTARGSSQNLRVAVNNWMQTFSNTGHEDKADKILERWLVVVEQAYGPNTLDAAITYLTAAQFMIQHNHLDRAHELINKALPIGTKMRDAAFVRALTDCAIAFQSTQHPEEAEHLFVDALEMADPAARLSVQLSLGALYTQQGNNAKAESLCTAIIGEIKDQFGTGDPQVNAEIRTLIENSLKHSDFQTTQTLIDTLNNREHYRARRNGLNPQESEAYQAIEVILQTYERRQDYGSAAKICKLQIDKFADKLDSASRRNLYSRYSNILRSSGDADAATFYDARAKESTDTAGRLPH